MDPWRKWRKRPATNAVAGFKFVRRVYQHALAGAHLVRRVNAIPIRPSRFLYRRSGDARDKAAARRIGSGLEKSRG